MDTKKLGRQTVRLTSPPSIAGFGSAVGKKEGQGPLGRCFDFASQDDSFAEKSWEKAETAMQKQALSYALDKAGISSDQLDYVFAGDLLNQCIATSYSLRAQNAPFFGLYGACSTMAEGMSLAAMLVDGGFASYAAALTSSHFCSAERQYRNPLEYGGQKPPTAQWTTTGSGAIILSRKGTGPFITHVTTGKVVDKGITDANNMGAAMAPAGKLLDLMLSLIDLDRSKVYIANIVKCRPPRNRDPLNTEQDACIGYLRAQTALIRPKIIVCLGRIAAMRIIDKGFRITKQHGQWFDRAGVQMTAIYHPSAVLRDPLKGPDTFVDLKGIQAKVRELCPDSFSPRPE